MRRARRLGEETELTHDDEAAIAGAGRPSESRGAVPRLLPVVAGALILGVAVLAVVGRGLIERVGVRMFGPPPVTMEEAYTEPANPQTFDHGDWDAILGAHVEPGGWVRYADLATDPAPLEAYLDRLAVVEFDALGRDEKLALLINAYNAFTIRLILDHDAGGTLSSIRDIPAEERWDAVRWELGGRTFSLNQIEHERIRPRFRESRIHFALVCAAYSCPPLRREAYTGARLDRQLDDQMRLCHSGPRWFRFDRNAGVVHRTELYDWYRGDFEQEAESLLDYMARYSPALGEALSSGRELTQRKIDYDWSLNRAGREPDPPRTARRSP